MTSRSTSQLDRRGSGHLAGIPQESSTLSVGSIGSALHVPFSHSYTTEEASADFGSVMKAVVVSAASSVLSGYDQGVIAAAMLTMKPALGLTSVQHEVSCPPNAAPIPPRSLALTRDERVTALLSCSLAGLHRRA